MSLYPIFFLIVFIFGSLAALGRGPIWGLVTYVYIYFNIPNHQWWGNQLPDLRWSFISAGILLVSCFLHKDKLSPISWNENLVGRWLLALLVLMIVIIPFTLNPAQSWEKAFNFFRYVLIFFIVGKVLNDFRRYKVFLGILLFCNFYLTVLAYHYFNGSRLEGVGLPDASSANMLAGLMVLMIPLYLVLVVTERGWQRWASLGALPFVLNTFVMCGSRGAFVGFLMQLIVTLYLLRKQVGLMKVLFFCAVVSFGLFSLMSDQYSNRIFGIKSGIEQESISEISAGRWDIWRYGLEMVGDYPLGTGGDGFLALSVNYLPDYLIERRAGVRASHNTYLLVLVEQGIVGLLIFMGFICSQLYLLSKTRKIIVTSTFIDLNSSKGRVIPHTYAVQISLVGFWTTAFFADRLYFEAIYLVIGLVPVLFCLAKQNTIPVLKEQKQFLSFKRQQNS